jgi:hypothetical protein
MRLMTALAMEQSEEWETSPRRYMDIDKLEDWVIENNMHVPWLEGPRVWPFDEPTPAPDEEPAKA